MNVIGLFPSTKKIIPKRPINIRTQPILIEIFRAASTDFVSINFPQNHPPTILPAIPPKPFSYQAYRSWASFGNDNYPENFCHKTGKPSNGKTSMRKPIF